MTDDARRTARPLDYLKTARNIAQRADAEKRGFTDAERADVTRLMTKARSTR